MGRTPSVGRGHRSTIALAAAVLVAGIAASAVGAEAKRYQDTVRGLAAAIGIPPEARARVFERFGRAHAERGYTGTGLGLSLCQRIVERHGGAIGVEDNPGGGSRFWFTLPAAGAGAEVSPGARAVPS